MSNLVIASGHTDALRWRHFRDVPLPQRSGNTRYSFSSAISLGEPAAITSGELSGDPERAMQHHVGLAGGRLIQLPALFAGVPARVVRRLVAA